MKSTIRSIYIPLIIKQDKEMIKNRATRKRTQKK
jgi:hypothetical protein